MLLVRDAGLNCCRPRRTDVPCNSGQTPLFECDAGPDELKSNVIVVRDTNQSEDGTGQDELKSIVMLVRISALKVKSNGFESGKVELSRVKKMEAMRPCGLIQTEVSSGQSSLASDTSLNVKQSTGY